MTEKKKSVDQQGQPVAKGYNAQESTEVRTRETIELGYHAARSIDVREGYNPKESSTLIPPKKQKEEAND